MLSTSSSSTKREALRRSFRLYADWYLDSHPEDNLAGILEDQGRKYATELYQQTAAIAPSEATIASDVQARGWKIPKKFRDGRLGRGWPQQWTGWAYVEALKNKVIRKKRGRNAKAANIEQENAIRDAKPTLEQMQAFVIAMRRNARLFLASGWLVAIEKLGGALKSSSGRVDPKRGGAEIRHTATSHEVVIWNATPGIEEQNEKHQLIAKAAAVRVADMMVYIRRKMDEAARRYLRAA